MYPNTTLGMKTAKFYQQEKEALARQNLLAQTCYPAPIAPDRWRYVRLIITLIALAFILHLVAPDMTSGIFAQNKPVANTRKVDINPYHGTTPSLDCRTVNMLE